MRLLTWITGALREPETPHFHSGPTRPVVCFDSRCDSPRLDVGRS